MKCTLTDLLATDIIIDQPDYDLFENNCQNFGKYLVEKICPGALGPETIHDFIQRVLFEDTIVSNRVIPGTYPRSNPRSEFSSYSGTFASALSTFQSPRTFFTSVDVPVGGGSAPATGMTLSSTKC